MKQSHHQDYETIQRKGMLDLTQMSSQKATEALQFTRRPGRGGH
jgi:hypothetical protein